MYRKLPDRESAQASAAFLLATDQSTDAEIAHRLGITRRTLTRWKDMPQVQRWIEEHRKEAQESFKLRMLRERQASALPGNRLEALKRDQGQYSIRINDQFRVCFRCQNY